MKLTITGRKRETIDVTPNDTIGDIMERLDKKRGYVMVHNEEALQKEKTVSHYGLSATSTVFIKSRYYIGVSRPVGGTIKVKLWKKATVLWVKKYIQEHRGIPIANQTLTHMGEILSPDTCKLSDFGVAPRYSYRHENDCAYATVHLEIQDPSEETDAADLDLHQGADDCEVADRIEKSPRKEYQTTRDADTAGLDAAVDNLRFRMKKVENENDSLRKQLQDLQVQLLRRKPAPESIRRHKLMRNFTQFLDLDVGIARELFQANVFGLAQYSYITDITSDLSSEDRIEAMLLEVLESESNVAVLHNILKEKPDKRSNELTKLLE